jgi:hypothetical protein
LSLLLLLLLLPLLHISAFAGVYILYGPLAFAEHSNEYESLLLLLLLWSLLLLLLLSVCACT